MDANELLDLAILNLSTAIEESGAVITADRLPTLFGDTSLLVAVLQNLLGNAIKFCREDQNPEDHSAGTRGRRELALHLFRQRNRYRRRICRADLHHLSTPAPQGGYAGTGIGLALCRKIVEYHGGEIWLETSMSTTEGPDPGSTFCFTLPMVELADEPEVLALMSSEGESQS